MESIKGHRGQKRHFYFIPATGSIHEEPPAMSEFVVFRLKLEDLIPVQAALALTRVHPRKGIMYPPQFMNWATEQNTWLWTAGGPFLA